MVYIYGIYVMFNIPNGKLHHITDVFTGNPSSIRTIPAGPKVQVDAAPASGKPRVRPWRLQIFGGREF
jgi:hypothetical protein